MDLDALPKMRLDLWPQYSGPNGLQPQIISSYSRGCKMDCSFCYRTTPQERAKSPEKMDEELTFPAERWVELAAAVRAKRFPEDKPTEHGVWNVQARFLSRKGFSADIIYRVLGQV